MISEIPANRGPEINELPDFMAETLKMPRRSAPQDLDPRPSPRGWQRPRPPCWWKGALWSRHLCHRLWAEASSAVTSWAIRGGGSRSAPQFPQW